jgi:hypothetical protein
MLPDGEGYGEAAVCGGATGAGGGGAGRPARRRWRRCGAEMGVGRRARSERGGGGAWSLAGLEWGAGGRRVTWTRIPAEPSRRCINRRTPPDTPPPPRCRRCWRRIRRRRADGFGGRRWRCRPRDAADAVGRGGHCWFRLGRVGSRRVRGEGLRGVAWLGRNVAEACLFQGGAWKTEGGSRRPLSCEPSV